MANDLYVSSTGGLARVRELDIVANNLANADTAGFKRDRAVFESDFESALRTVKDRLTGGVPGRVFVRSAEASVDFSQGPIAETGDPLSVAIQGRGFFEVLAPEGVRYTRAGSFVINTDGLLSTPDGYPVVGDGGPVAVGDRPVEIRANGQVIDDAGEVLGAIGLVDFADSSTLEKVGRTLFRARNEESRLGIENPRLVPKSIEGSNVNPARELGAMTILQRSFDIVMQTMRAADRNTEQLIREVSQ